MPKPLPSELVRILQRDLGWTGGDLLIRVLLRTGMRTSELYKVKPDDITSEAIHIRASKGSRDRPSQPLARDTSDRLPAAFKTAMVTYGSSASILTAKPSTASMAGFGSLMRCYWGRRRFQLLGAFGTPYGLHSLRATGATSLLHEGVDIYTVQLWLGHRALSSTIPYLEAVKTKGLSKLML